MTRGERTDRSKDYCGKFASVLGGELPVPPSARKCLLILQTGGDG
jgi:hypothetical protein